MATETTVISREIMAMATITAPITSARLEMRPGCRLSELIVSVPAAGRIPNRESLTRNAGGTHSAREDFLLMLSQKEVVLTHRSKHINIEHAQISGRPCGVRQPRGNPHGAAGWHLDHFSGDFKVQISFHYHDQLIERMTVRLQSRHARLEPVERDDGAVAAQCRAT